MKIQDFGLWFSYDKNGSPGQRAWMNKIQEPQIYISRIHYDGISLGFLLPKDESVVDLPNGAIAVSSNKKYILNIKTPIIYKMRTCNYHELIPDMKLSDFEVILNPDWKGKV
jgi:hypothetical protein